jgi:hypothetical protein
VATTIISKPLGKSDITWDWSLPWDTTQEVWTVTEGKRYNDALDIQENSYEELSSIMNKEIQAWFQQWQNHWAWCTNLQREYYEGGMMQFCLDKNLCL